MKSRRGRPPLLAIGALAAGLLLGAPAGASAQWAPDAASEAHLLRGIGLVYNLSFDSARAEFRTVVRADSTHPAGWFFLAMVDWWRIAADFDNTSLDDRFLAELDRVIDLCDARLERNDRDVVALFYKGGALGFQGRLHGNRDDWMKAANAGREALPIVRKAYELAPGNDDILMGIGIYNYFAAVIPDLYPFVKPFMVFFPAGDRAMGLGQLAAAAAKGRYASVEASYFLMVVYQNFENRPADARAIAERLHAAYPANAVFDRYVGRCAASLGDWAALRRVFEGVMSRVAARRTGYDKAAEREAEYYLGLCDMENGRYDDALSRLYRADELSRALDAAHPSGFMALTNLRIGMINDIQGKRAVAVAQYNKVLDMRDALNAHRQAEEYLRTPYRRP